MADDRNIICLHFLVGLPYMSVKRVAWLGLALEMRDRCFGRPYGSQRCSRSRSHLCLAERIRLLHCCPHSPPLCTTHLVQTTCITKSGVDYDQNKFWSFEMNCAPLLIRAQRLNTQTFCLLATHIFESAVPYTCPDQMCSF